MIGSISSNSSRSSGRSSSSGSINNKKQQSDLSDVYGHHLLGGGGGGDVACLNINFVFLLFLNYLWAGKAGDKRFGTVLELKM